ncbi:MAG: glycosyltransferase family 2 protein [Lachnospiraceae bacterium]|nr:glycosyltransferase family 2 protein [Lachnospiraceae bacterium]
MSKLGNLKKYLLEYGMDFTMKKTASKFHLYEMKQDDFYPKWRRDHLLSAKEVKAISLDRFKNRPKIQIVVERDGLELKDILSLDADWFLFSSSRARLHESLEYEVNLALEKNPNLQFIYFDNDHLKGKKYYRPELKPGFSLDYLYGYDYIGSTFLVKKDILKEVKDAKIDGALSRCNWLDLKLYILEKIAEKENKEYIENPPRVHEASRYVCRIERVLYSEPQQKRDTLIDEFQKTIIKKHVELRGISAEVEETDISGYYHLSPVFKEKPLVSVIIPNKDHTDDLIQCVESLYQIDKYHNLEIIVVENNSEEEKTFRDYSELLGSEYDPDKECIGRLCDGVTIKIVTWKQGFNYSAINNFGARFATGEMILLLNNDTEIISEHTISELVSSCQRDRVGAAGALLYYADDTIQHAGIVIKIGGFAANELTCKEYGDPQYYPYTRAVREMSGCTAACLMVRRELFNSIGGFDEELVVALNDVDLCMRVREAGYKILFNPFATLHHYESKSRGLEETDEKRERFEREIRHFQSKWQEDLDEGDPYYNVAFTLHYADYSLEMEEDNRGRYQA